MSGIYCQLGDYMPPTSTYHLLREPKTTIEMWDEHFKQNCVCLLRLWPPKNRMCSSNWYSCIVADGHRCQFSQLETETNHLNIHLLLVDRGHDFLVNKTMENWRCIAKLRTSTWNFHQVPLEVPWFSWDGKKQPFVLLLRECRPLSFVGKWHESKPGLNPQRLFNLRGGRAALGRRCGWMGTDGVAPPPTTWVGVLGCLFLIATLYAPLP